jgi:ArsR family transcriptional regulator
MVIHRGIDFMRCPQNRAGTTRRLTISPLRQIESGVNNSLAIRQSRRQRAAVFKALGHPSRLQIVEALGGGERCVCELVEVVGAGWSTVSRHLAVLKGAGILEDEKRGLQVYYRLVLPCVSTFIECLDAAKNGAAVEVRRCCPR